MLIPNPRMQQKYMAIPFEMIAAVVSEFARLGMKSLSPSPRAQSPMLIKSEQASTVDFNLAFDFVKCKPWHDIRWLELPDMLFEIHSNDVVMPSPSRSYKSLNGAITEKKGSIDHYKIVIVPGLQFKMLPYKLQCEENRGRAKREEISLSWLIKNHNYRSRSLSERRNLRNPTFK